MCGFPTVLLLLLPLLCDWPITSSRYQGRGTKRAEWETHLCASASPPVFKPEKRRGRDETMTSENSCRYTQINFLLNGGGGEAN